MNIYDEVRRKNRVLPVPLIICDTCLKPMPPEAMRYGRRKFKSCQDCRLKALEKTNNAIKVLESDRAAVQAELDFKSLAAGEKDEC